MARSRNIKFAMSPNPIVLDGSTTVAQAAKTMRAQRVGDVIVSKNDRVFGILTDRDIVVRGVARGFNADNTRIEDICTCHLATLSPGSTEDDAVALMRKSAVRRLPVVEGGKAVGIVSIGDLAVQLDPDSALGAISAATPNG